MSEHVIIIEAPGEWHRKLGCQTYLADFANILKAFIGSGFLAIPFSYSKCGLALGVVAFMLITLMSLHCAQLLVKAKYGVIQHVLDLYLYPSRLGVRPRTRHRATAAGTGISSWRHNLLSTQLFTDHLLPPEILEQGAGRGSRRTQAEAQDIHRQLVQGMKFGDLARLCFGQLGMTACNAAILFTQICFCINFAIFTANTIQGFFPSYNCIVQARNNAVVTSSDCRYLDNSPWLPELLNDTGAENNDTLGFDYVGGSPSTIPDSERAAARNFSLTPTLTSASTVMTRASNDVSNTPVSEPKSASGGKTTCTSSAALHNETSPLTNNTDDSTTRGPDPTLGTAGVVWEWSWTDSPDLRVLMVVPVALDLVLVLPRRMRTLGFISVAGSVGLLVGTLLILVTLITQFRMSDTWSWARFEGLAFFFGTVSASYEGAGTVLSVEASMKGNHHNYNVSLSGALLLLVALHTSIGVLSYLSFGADTAQAISMNLDVGSGLGLVLSCSLMAGIMLTFPLMAYPVLQLLESACLGPAGSAGGCCGRRAEKESGEAEALLSELEASVAMAIPDTETVLREVPSWKRNGVRFALVLFVGLMAVLLRNSFAYVASFAGSLGSSFVAYVFPCMFHLKTCWHQLPLYIRLKDFAIIVLGLIFSVLGVATVITDMLSL